ETYTDRLGRTVREKSGGIYTDYTYDKQGKVLTAYKIGQSEKNANAGLLTLNVYDENGNQTDTVLNPSYDTASKALKVTGSSIRTKSVFDATGKEVKRIDALGNETKMDYNIKGELTKVAGPKTSEDDAGNPLSDKMDFKYNIPVSANKVKNERVDANGNISIEEVDALGQTVKVADLGDGKTGTDAISTSYEYDIDGNKIKETEAKGNFRTFSYDEKKRLIKVEYSDEKGEKKLKTVYGYDIYDNISKMQDYKYVDGDGVQYRFTAYSYDAFGRQTAFVELNTADPNPAETALASKRIRYTYTVDDQISTVIYPKTLTGIEVLKYNYNSYKWLTSIKAKVKGKYKKIRDYTYDNTGKVKSIKDYRNFATKKDTKKTKTKKAKKGKDIYTLTSFSYDKFERVTSQVVKDSKNLKVIKEKYSASYDKNSNILVEKIYSNQSLGKQNLTRAYTYDNAGRLTKVTDTDHLKANAVATKTYKYDLVGNRIEENVSSENTAEKKTRYEYNSLNQLMKTNLVEEGSADEGEGGEVESLSEGEEEIPEKVTLQKAYTYDKNGNEIKVDDSIAKTTRESSYDPANRLSSLTDKKDGETLLVQDNEYNGNGQRIKKTENITVKATGKPDTNKITERSYAYQAGQALYTEDRSATNQTTLSGTSKISSFNMLGVSDNIVATERRTTNTKVPRVYYFYNKDLRASTTSVIAESGAAVKAYKYDEFGNT
ncbi:MAG: hypothetical protein ACRCUS_03605, partial [Anaerovoracaceae bacterium]